MYLPEDLKYTQDHEWIRIEDEIAYVGITDYAQKELGDIIYVDVTTVGEKMDQGEVFGYVEAVKAVSDLFMPITGKILEVNEKLEKISALINEDPYTEGWIIKISFDKDISLDNLLNKIQYEALL